VVVLVVAVVVSLVIATHARSHDVASGRPLGPPAAAPDLFVDVEPQDITLPGGTVRGTLSVAQVTISVVSAAVVTQFRQGDDRLSAPPQQMLIAFEIVLHGGESATVLDLTGIAIGVEIDHGPLRPLPHLAPIPNVDRFYVLAVPTSATTVELVARDASGIDNRATLWTS